MHTIVVSALNPYRQSLGLRVVDLPGEPASLRRRKPKKDNAGADETEADDDDEDGDNDLSGSDNDVDAATSGENEPQNVRESLARLARPRR